MFKIKTIIYLYGFYKINKAYFKSSLTLERGICKHFFCLTHIEYIKKMINENLEKVITLLKIKVSLPIITIQLEN